MRRAEAHNRSRATIRLMEGEPRPGQLRSPFAPWIRASARGVRRRQAATLRFEEQTGLQKSNRNTFAGFSHQLRVQIRGTKVPRFTTSAGTPSGDIQQLLERRAVMLDSGHAKHDFGAQDAHQRKQKRPARQESKDRAL